MFFLTYVMALDAGGLRVILPDFDLHASATAVVEVPDRLQEAIARGYKGQIPKSSCLEELQADERFCDGWWLWLNIDVDGIGRYRERAMKSDPTDPRQKRENPRRTRASIGGARSTGVSNIPSRRRK